MPGDAQPSATTTDPGLPRGRHHLNPADVRRSQRDRLLAATVAQVAADGYARTTVADLIRVAGISRRTFYELFTDKEDCFLAAFDENSAAVTGAVTAALTGVHGREARVRASFATLCQELAARPEFTEILLITAAEAGPRARRRRNRMYQVGVDLIQDLVHRGTAPDADPPPSESAARAIVGATEALLVQHVSTRGVARLPELVPTLTEVAAALLLSPVTSPPD
ncbi:MAG: TetR/AcrR family transcriptional regulator [Propionibacteriales bacterium]|nr:TetR/AcrR family transcriptional regulator [Propionibacteriales bacterium]